MVVVTYDIDPKYGGLVIGKGGSNIQALRAMQGVQSIVFDTRMSPCVYKLKVIAVSRAVCENVYKEVQRKIQACSVTSPGVQHKIQRGSVTSREVSERRKGPNHTPGVRMTLIDVADRSLDVIALRAYESKGAEAVVVNLDPGMFVISCFILFFFQY